MGHIVPVRLGRPSSSKLAESLTGSTAMAAELRRVEGSQGKSVWRREREKGVMEGKGVEVAVFI